MVRAESRTSPCFAILLTFGFLAGGGEAAEHSRSLGARSGLEEVIVEGEQPGPGLWKITKGSNVLWILGTYAPLPQRVTWRSKQVEEVIASSSQVFGAYSVSLRVPDSGALRSQTRKLRSSLTASQYKRWQRLRDKYIGPNVQTENLLPATAALMLQSQAFERSGLTYSDDLWSTIYGLAHRHHVPIVSQDFALEPPSMGTGMRELRTEELDRVAGAITWNQTRSTITTETCGAGGVNCTTETIHGTDDGVAD